MARKVFHPISQKFGEREIYRDQNTFAGGLYADPPHSEIPDNAVARLENAHAHSQYLRGRNGSRLYSDTTYPAITGKTGLTLSQSGTLITRTGGSFTQADVSNWIVWDDGTNTEITRYISATVVETQFSATRTSTNAYIRGRVNSRYWHSTLRKIVMHIGNEFYVADSIAMSTWTRIIILEGTPSNATSSFDEQDDFTICGTSNGLFKIVLDTTYPYAFQINSPVPTVKVSSGVQEDQKTYGRRVLYSMCRMTGEEPFRNRNSANTDIELESGTVEATEDEDDFSEIWTEEKIGANTKTQGRLTCAALATADHDVSEVWEIITDGTFIITYTYANNTAQTETVYVDFTGVVTLREVADRIQTASRVFFPDIECWFSNNHFVFSSGEIDGTSISWLTDGAAGTNIADNLLGRAADGGSLDTAFVYEQPTTITGLRVPTRSSLSTIAQRQWTHYSIYETLDIGNAGTDPITGEANVPDRFVWAYDLRVAASFYAEKSTDSIVTAEDGEFEEADVGSVIGWRDGDRDTIIAFISSTQVRVATETYFDNPKSLMAAAIGNGEVTEASQSSNTVTWSKGTNFADVEVGDTIYWPDGRRSQVSALISDTQVRVSDSTTRSATGMTFHPTGRNYYDRVSDDKLRSRINKGIWLLQQRFHTAIPNGNMIVVTPAFIFVAAREDTVINYGTYEPAYRYLLGYHYSYYQVETSIKDAITHMEEFPNRLIVFCSKKTYGGPVNESTQFAVKGTGSFVTTFNGFQLVDGNIGVRDWGSIRKPIHGKSILVTSEPAVREFDGYSYGQNLAEDEARGMEKVMNELRSWFRASGSCYHPDLGYVIWGRKK